MSFELTITKYPDWWHATVEGQNTPANVSTYMRELFEACVEGNCSKLLIEERLDGPRLGTIDVFDIASKRADDMRGVQMPIAYVDMNAAGDLMAFAEMVAKNHGSMVKVFTTLAEAEALLSRL